jgi:lysozyme
MRLDTAGQKYIQREEGDVLHPYLDSAGVPTIGYGNTHYENGVAVTMEDAPITEARAMQLWLNMIAVYENAVTALVKKPINQNQFNALVSFTENEGVGHFKGSTLLKKVNVNPNDPEIRDEFNKWVYAGGVKSKGLITRRAQDADLYFM